LGEVSETKKNKFKNAVDKISEAKSPSSFFNTSITFKIAIIAIIGSEIDKAYGFVDLTSNLSF